MSCTCKICSIYIKYFWNDAKKKRHITTEISLYHYITTLRHYGQSIQKTTPGKEELPLVQRISGGSWQTQTQVKSAFYRVHVDWMMGKRLNLSNILFWTNFSQKIDLFLSIFLLFHSQQMFMGREMCLYISSQHKKRLSMKL